MNNSGNIEAGWMVLASPPAAGMDEGRKNEPHNSGQTRRA